MEITCFHCNGTGISPTTGNTCHICGGDGDLEPIGTLRTIRAYTVDSHTKLVDLADKVDDVMDKCNDIKEVIDNP